MNIIEATTQIIKMYNSSENPSETEWREIFEKFDNALKDCDDLDILLKCIVYDNNWYLPFDYRTKLMEKTKNLGADSYEFLVDYYSYKVSFLDPGEEYDESSRLLDELNENHS